MRTRVILEIVISHDAIDVQDSLENLLDEGEIQDVINDSGRGLEVTSILIRKLAEVDGDG
jgi:ABC-type antimicrobial peptide transport system ATPase subunit